MGHVCAFVHSYKMFRAIRVPLHISVRSSPERLSEKRPPFRGAGISHPI